MPVKKNTRERILNTLADEMMKRPFSEIKLDSILETAGVPRPTFYYHFSSLKDVPQKMMQIFVDIFRNEYRNSKAYGDRRVLTEVWQKKEKDDVALFAQVYENRHLFAALIGSEFRTEFLERLLEIFTERERALNPVYLDDEGNIIYPEEKERSYIISLQAGGAVSFLINWCSRNFQETPEEFQRIQYEMFGRSDRRLVYEAYLNKKA